MLSKRTMQVNGPHARTTPTERATCSAAWPVPLNSGNERSAIGHCTDARLVSPPFAELQEHQTCHTTTCTAAP